MAYPAGTGPLRSPREESFAFRNTVGTQMGASSNDVRGQLHRRFTTNNIPTLSTPLSPIGQQRRQAAEPTEFTTAVRTHRSYTPNARDGSDTYGAHRRLAMQHSRTTCCCSAVALERSCRCRLCACVGGHVFLDIEGDLEFGLTDQSTDVPQASSSKKPSFTSSLPLFLPRSPAGSKIVRV